MMIIIWDGSTQELSEKSQAGDQDGKVEKFGGRGQDQPIVGPKQFPGSRPVSAWRAFLEYLT